MTSRFFATGPVTFSDLRPVSTIGFIPEGGDFAVHAFGLD